MKTLKIIITIWLLFMINKVYGAITIDFNPICPGGVVKLTSTGSSPYVWQYNNDGFGPWTDISSDFGPYSGAGTSVLTITTTDASLNGYYYRCKENGSNSNEIILTVYPVPTVDFISGQNYCNGATAPATALSGPVSGTTFTWTNSNTSIGLAASGSGTPIPTYTATNPGTTSISGNISITPVANGCTGTVSGYTVTVNPTPTVNAVSDQVYCNLATAPAIALSGSVSGTTFNWTNSNTSIGLAASGSGTSIPTYTATNTGAAPISGNISITPVANSCTGTATGYAVTVNPTPTVDAISNQAYCNLAIAPTTALSGPVSGTTFTWNNSNTSIGLAASGSGTPIPTYSATNPGTAPISGNISITPVANSCTGTVSGYTVTVNPIPTVNAVSDQVYCNLATAPATALSGSVSGTTFNWTNSNTSIGLAASGTGTSIPTYTATNSGTAPISGNISITPVANSCTGSGTGYTVTVNPTPTADAISNQVYCNLATAPTTAISGPVSGTTFTWTNSNTSIGLASSGSGTPIPTYTATNSGTAPISGNISITPVANSCTGTVSGYTVTINPTPTVNAISNQVHCNLATAPATALSGPVSGTTFTWTNSNTSIGLAANGSGTPIPTYTATNSGTTPISGNISITPVANSCTGTVSGYTVTVNPTPTVNAISNQVYCNLATAPTTALSGPVSGTTFTWTNSNTSIGLAVSGSGTPIPTYTATNSGTAPISGNISITPVANSCTGTISGYTITVNPTPTVNAISNQVYCNLATAPTTALSGPVSGTTFTWTNSNTAIGLTASGTGTPIPTYTASNTTTATITGNILITPTANGCTGTASGYTVTVYPTPTVNAISNQVYCNNATAPTTALSGPVSGTTFTWTNSNTSIGLGASGSGTPIPTYTATNSSSAPIVGNISITPVANSCTGTVSSYTVTVNPTPIVTATPMADSICNGTATNITLNTPTTLTSGSVTFDYTASSPGGFVTGFSSPVTGLTNGYRITNVLYNNSSTEPQTVTYHITPKAGTTGCADGTPIDVVITVNPTSVITSSASAKWCSNTLTNYNITSPNSPVTFTWSRPLVGGIVNSAGNGSGSPISETLINGTTGSIDVHYFIIPKVNGCDGTTKDVTVTVYPPISVNITPSPASICAGSNLSLNGNPSGGSGVYTTHTWTGSGAGFLSPNNIVNPVFRTWSANTYNLNYTVTDNNNCSATNSRTVTVNPKPNISVTNSEQVCIGDALNLTCNYSGIGSYSWSKATGITFSSDEKSPVVTGSALAGNAGIFTLKVTNEYICDSVVTTSVVVNSLPDADATSTPVCTDQALYLNGSSTVSPVTYTWKRLGVTIGSGSNFLVSPNANTSMSGTYVLTVKDGNSCSKDTSVTAIVYQLPTALASNNGPLCVGKTLNLTGGINGLLTYSWTGPAFALPISGQNQSVAGVTVATAGDYILTVTDALGCSKKDTTTLTVNTLPNSQFNPPPKTNYSTSETGGTKLYGLPAGGTFWGDGVVSINSTFYPSIAGPKHHNLYYATVNSNGCTDTAIFGVYVGIDSAHISGLSDVFCIYADSSTVVGWNNGPNKGTLSGTGLYIPDPVNRPDSGFFYPKRAHPGEYDIKYLFIKAGDQSDSVIFRVKVDSVEVPFLQIQDSKWKFCSSAGSKRIDALNLKPSGGSSYWTGPSSIFYPEIDHATFYPQDSVVEKKYVITYRYKALSECSSDIISDTITVYPKPSVGFKGLKHNYDYALKSVKLEGTHSGGSFTGVGLSIVGNILNPSASRLNGINTLTYDYTDGNTCTNDITESVGIIASKALIDAPDTLCYAGSVITIRVAASDRDTSLNIKFSAYSNTGTIDTTKYLITSTSDSTADFDPKVAGSGVHTITIAYDYYRKDIDTTHFTKTKDIKVDIIDPIIIYGLQAKYCSNKNVQQITTDAPPGGTGSFSIPGSSASDRNGFYDDGKTAHFFLDSIISNKLAGYGESIPLTFIYTSDLKCVARLDTSFIINEVPVAHIKVYQACLDAQDTIHFFDDSRIVSDKIKFWNWKFGDLNQNDSVGKLKNPSWKYSGNITATVSLLVSTDNCSSTLYDTIIKVGDVLKADFNWEDECYVDTVPTNFKSVVNVPTNDHVKSFAWIFSLNGNTVFTSNNESPSYQFGQLASYNISLKTVSDSGCVDSLSKTIDLRPWIRLSESDYSQAFNQTQNGWFSYAANDTDKNIWQLGIPDENIFEVPAGEKVWYTRVDSFVRNSITQDLRSAWVTGPCFDFTGVKKPMIKMKIRRALDQNVDGGVLQYSIDKGKKWYVIGAKDEGINWYNSISIKGQPANQPWGWTGTGQDVASFDTSWITVRHSLDALKEKPNVRFRVAYGLQPNMSSITRGFAFDDIWVGERSKTVLLEHFTNLTNSISADYQLNNEIRQYPYDLLDIRYHTTFSGNDELANAYKAGPNTKAFYYGIPRVPYTVIDGNYGIVDYSNIYWDANINKSIEQRILEDPAFSFSGFNCAKSGSGIVVKLKITANKDINSETVLYVAIVEKNVRISSASITSKNVLRKFLPDPSGTFFSKWYSSQTDSIEFARNYNNIVNPDSVIVIAFIQDGKTKEVYQAATDDHDFLTKSGAPELNKEKDSVLVSNTCLLYPNPAKEKAYVAFNKPLENESVLQVYNQLGLLVKTMRIEKDISLIVINTAEFKPGIYLIRIAGNWQVPDIPRLIVTK